MAYPDNGMIQESVFSTTQVQYSAVNLFLEGARRVQLDLEFTNEDLQNIALICKLLDGMPLGVELAAAWMVVLKSHEIAEEIQNSIDFLKTERRDAHDRHQSIRTVFDSTWKMLSKKQQKLFRKLSVFVGGFTREAAQYISSASLQDLMAFTNKSLIQRDINGRFRIHELLRQYASEKLDQSPLEKEETQTRFGEYYADYVHQKESELQGGDQSETLLEIDNIRSSWSWAVSRGDFTIIRKCTIGILYIYMIQGWYEELGELLGPAEEALRTKKPAGEKGIAFGLLLAGLGYAFYLAGKYRKGREYIHKSQNILRKLEAKSELAISNFIVYVADNTKSESELKRILEECIAISRDTGIPWIESNALYYLGNVAMYQGKFDEAKAVYLKALKTNKEMNAHRGIAISLGGLGDIALRKREYQEAKDLFTEELFHAKKAGYHARNARAYSNLGYVALLNQEYEVAEANYHQALAIRQKSGWQLQVTTATFDMGNVAFALDEYKTAKERYLEALAKLHSPGDQQFIGYILSSLGNVAVAMDDYQEARDRYRAALEIAEDIGDIELHLDVLAGLAGLVNRTDNAERAVELGTLAVNHSRTDPLPRERAIRLLEKLKANLPPDVFNAAWEYVEGAYF
jgi:tetratricopeptide (TPR) repeat protein